MTKQREKERTSQKKKKRQNAVKRQNTSVRDGVSMTMGDRRKERENKTKGRTERERES